MKEGFLIQRYFSQGWTTVSGLYRRYEDACADMTRVARRMELDDNTLRVVRCVVSQTVEVQA